VATLQTKLGLLNSWKEIATYLGRGVRTAQRWERYGLPVRRLAPGPRASVIADAEDIDVWMSSAKTTATGAARDVPPSAFCGELNESIKQSRQLRSENAALRASGKKTLAELIANIHRLERNLKSSIPRHNESND
jgi:hypothetical protein